MKQRAFSLVELSIVLVILGLLVGGILSARSLIHGAELRSVARDFQKYQTAIMAFRDKYFYLPGDMPNATSVWGLAGGTAAAADATCNAVISTSSATCNGDGLGDIFGIYEGFRGWQQLANAGLIEGQFSGTFDAVNAVGPDYIQPGLNVAASRIPQGGFLLGAVAGPQRTYFGVTGGTGSQFSGRTITLVRPLTVAGVAGPSGNVFWGAIGHEDAWNIDTKMDDGRADTGKVRADVVRPAIDITDMTCHSYDLTNTTNYCALGYIFLN